jgi:hypothetical protein
VTRKGALRGLALAAWLVGCGRIGFDPLTDGGAHGDGGSGDGGAIPDGGGPPDGASACDPTECAAFGGGVCMAGVCVFDVTAGGEVVCPPGNACEIDCNAAAACTGSIDCSMATSCTINCNVSGSCQGGSFNCGDTGCDVYCRAQDTCANLQFMCGMPCDVECCASLTCNGISGTVVHAQGTCP